MKKSVFAIALMASLLAGATDTGTDSYLYWMVNVNEDKWKYDYSVQVNGETENPAGSSLLNLYYADSSDPVTSIKGETLGAYKDNGTGLYAQLLSNMNYKSFVFEIVCDTRVITSETVSYTDVLACIAGGGIGTPAQNLLAVSMALPVPEPSSGLLLLLGVAGLALRRRKQIAA